MAWRSRTSSAEATDSPKKLKSTPMTRAPACFKRRITLA
jgi:hypothetical protein